MRFKHDMSNYGPCTRFVTGIRRYPRITVRFINALNLINFEFFRVVFLEGRKINS